MGAMQDWAMTTVTASKNHLNRNSSSNKKESSASYENGKIIEYMGKMNL
jgi:hypothetical protein